MTSSARMASKMAVTNAKKIPPKISNHISFFKNGQHTCGLKMAFVKISEFAGEMV